MEALVALMGKFLNQWNDSGYQPAEDWDPTVYENEQQARLIAIYNMASHAADIPRRLSDADPDELAADKQLSRKIRTRTATLAVIWGATINAEDYTSDTEAHTKGAQVIWPNWWADHKARMQNELRIVATTALKTGQEKVGNKFCNRLLNELNTIGQLFGEA
jgi:hypothetical protein